MIKKNQTSSKSKNNLTPSKIPEASKATPQKPSEPPKKGMGKIMGGKSNSLNATLMS